MVLEKQRIGEGERTREVQEEEEINTRLIDADALMRRFMDKPPEYYHASYIVGEINTAPTIDAVPVVRGRWIDESVVTGTTSGGITHIRQFRCSVCGGLFGRLTDNYCYNCGARMEGEDVCTR